MKRGIRGAWTWPGSLGRAFHTRPSGPDFAGAVEPCHVRGLRRRAMQYNMRVVKKVLVAE